MIYKKPLYTLFLLLPLTFASCAVTFAQEKPSFPILKNADGYYQHPELKELYLQMKVSGNKLTQIKDWDGKEMLLDQQSDTRFSDAKGSYSLSFLKNSNNEISTLKIGQELWTKIPGYAPEKMPALTSTQVSAMLDQKAEQLVAAINSNSLIALTNFVNANFSATLKSAIQDNFLFRAKNAWRATGGVKFHKRLYFNANAFFGEYQYASEDLNNEFEFSLKLDQEGKIKLFNSRVVYSQDPVKKVSNVEALVADLDQTLKRLAQKDAFSGAVLLAKGDRILYESATGSAIKEEGVRNTLTTKFNLGSMNKMFTAVGIMQLVEQGKLNLNDPVAKFLDSTWLPAALADQIKVSHLLNHSAGVGDFFTEKFLEAPVAQFRTLEDYKPYVKVNKLEFEPGTSWAYSNSGMLLLGAIIEKVSGQNYFDYVQENIYKVAGMEASALRTFGGKEPGEANPDGGTKTKQAVGYLPKIDGSYEAVSNSAFTTCSPAGGGYSTVADLHKFGVALLSGKLLTDSSKHKMFKDELGKSYGYGFQLSGSTEKQVVGHGGGAPGVNAVTYIFPDSEYIIVVLSNYDRGAAELGEYLLNQLKSIVK
ncbi:serine hydrolase [Pedobacter sp. PLR]|uniref:serine hydrolase domain-containing protein n=1 Tax=Pedobacter sp. PLR TaxID=2994465 RepID=UPI002247DB39|nr:serine hydrolase domain-containing protein [Pedobacter sp. PLR]MCX2453720.1 serine hydrolase [Pedobacter sp. PLR]